MIRLNPKNFGALAKYALRYAMGRQTYAPGEVRDIVRPHLKDISNKDLYVMITDCRHQSVTGNYGDPAIDKPGWVKWEQELNEEWNRRVGCQN